MLDIVKDEQAREQRGFNLVHRTLKKRSRNVGSATFGQWYEVMQAREVQMTTCWTKPQLRHAAFLFRTRHRHSKLLFDMWRAVAVEECRKRHVMLHVVSKMRKGDLAAAIEGWCYNLAQIRAQEEDDHSTLLALIRPKVDPYRRLLVYLLKVLK